MKMKRAHRILKVAKAADIAAVAALARKIWRQHYVPFLGRAQVEYMLGKFQSKAAIAAQIREGCEYYLVRSAGADAGYFAVIPSPAEASALLSKIYVSRGQRGSGLGRMIVEFVEKRCAGMGIRALWLTVNRNNHGSIAFYKRMGFRIAGRVAKDIGCGFVMDDYKMVKQIEWRPEKKKKDKFG